MSLLLLLLFIQHKTLLKRTPAHRKAKRHRLSSQRSNIQASISSSLGLFFTAQNTFLHTFSHAKFSLSSARGGNTIIIRKSGKIHEFMN